MIDRNGFRLNVGIILTSNQELLWAKRLGKQAWQFPQGGIQAGETLEAALYRELYEEIGLSPNDVEVLAVSRNWLSYRLPKRYIRFNSKPLCIGQKQKWFLLRLTSDESHINLKQGKQPEFETWRWVDYWYPVDHVVEFKRAVYQKALEEFAAHILEAA